VAVSNVLGPMLDTVDRIVIGSVLGPQSVAHYQVPSNLAVRVRILPGAICGSLSPRLASLDTQSAMALANRALRVLSAALTPMIVFGIFLMQPFLTLWVGRGFALHAAPIGAVILVGVWFNCLAHVPYCHVQAIGRPNLGAYNHAVQVIPYILCLWVALHSLGLIGAAYVWSLRAAVDFALGFWAAGYRAGAARYLARHAAIVLAAYGLMLVFPWRCYAYFVTWTLSTGAAILLVLGNDAALRARVAGSISMLVRGAWRRS
jgi:O-antigen/teichoic acid export membrane protein